MVCLSPSLSSRSKKRTKIVEKLTVLFLIFASLLLFSCDSGLEITEISINRYPNKIVYQRAVDTELTLDGLEILITARLGSQSVYRWKEDIYQDCYPVEHTIDFHQKGVCPVTICRNHGACSFAIEVVDRPLT